MNWFKVNKFRNKTLINWYIVRLRRRSNPSRIKWFKKMQFLNLRIISSCWANPMRDEIRCLSSSSIWLNIWAGTMEDMIFIILMEVGRRRCIWRLIKLMQKVIKLHQVSVNNLYSFYSYFCIDFLYDARSIFRLGKSLFEVKRILILL